MGLGKTKCVKRGDHTVCVDTATGEKWKEGPGFVRKAVNFTKAAVSHVAKGSPKSSKETIEERFEICRNCPGELFEVVAPESRPKELVDLPVVGTCLHKKCGCFIHDQELFPNKLAWEDQKCPRRYWGG